MADMAPLWNKAFTFLFALLLTLDFPLYLPAGGEPHECSKGAKPLQQAYFLGSVISLNSLVVIKTSVAMTGPIPLTESTISKSSLNTGT